MKKRLSLDEYYQGIISQNRVVLGQAITLIESHLSEDAELASTLLDKILPHTGNALRIGITGVPGVGKSTFIETFGTHLIETGKKIAVLTIDPSSQLTRGSILGDKTRMESLSKNPKAFVRPSASGSVLGGVAYKTREAMLLCEAAGFDVILVETVGIGQSETSVKNMVDFFLLLMLAGAGDELQGIKKGIMEMADALVITKADGDNKTKASKAAAEYQHALHLFQPPASGWIPQVLTCSALENSGIEKVWETIEQYAHQTQVTNFWNSNRQQQNAVWFQECFQQLLNSDLFSFNGLQATKEKLEQQVIDQKISSQQAARKLLNDYHNAIKGNKS